MDDKVNYERLLELHLDGKPISEICREHGLSPTRVRDRFLAIQWQQRHPGQDTDNPQPRKPRYRGGVN